MNTHAVSAAIAPLGLSGCILYDDRQGRATFRYEREPQASSAVGPVHSCTKSVLSALVCIAMDKGLLPEPDTPISAFFPQLRHEADARKRAITLRHLLTMSAGFSWTEFGGANSFPRMTRSPDWVAFALAQPMAETPGTRWTYNSGVSQLLAAILTEAVGMSAARFAELHLFGPLGIEQYRWPTDPQGIHAGGFGLELAADDLLKFGLLFLRQGEWEGRALLSRSAVETATRPAIAVSAPERGRYGWHWWHDAASHGGRSVPYYYARGFGGQFVFVVPAAASVVVMTRRPPKKGKAPMDVFRERLAPLIVGADVAEGDEGAGG